MTRLRRLPYPLAYILGYRKSNHKSKSIPQWRANLWSFIASWLGIALLEIIFTYSKSFQSHDTPMIVASFGATAVLIYGVIESPLAQPRNVICGHLIGSLVGVIIAQLFLNIQHDWVSESQRIAVQWVGGATAMALALTLMQITKTVHPPAGATALIAVVTPNILEISWFYIGVVVLSAVMQVTVACLINNIERRYPQYWWTPHKPIQIDPSTINTIMPHSDEKGSEDVVADDLTAAEEGSITSCTLVEEAIATLRQQAESSKIPFTLLIPGSPLIMTPGLFRSEETIDLLNKISNSTQSNGRS